MKPTQPVVPVANVGELLAGMARTGFQGRRLGESVEAWASMIRDPGCTILLGLSGAMVPAGMGRVLADLASRNYFDVLVSTGANIFHDTCEHLGVRHYQGHTCADDQELFSRGIDRIHDIFAYEKEFRAVDRRIADFAKGIAPFKGSSREFIDRLGMHLRKEAPQGKSLIITCVEKGIPVFIPALADSSIGIGLVMARREGAAVEVDQLADVEEITAMVEGSKRTGVVYVGGGVPKNFIQQTQVIASIHGQDLEGHDYAVQFTTDAPHWGGLSGCTFDEAVSWGKESPTSQRVQVFCDATIALPIVASALVARGERRAGRK
ncbi:MAG TPA: deoxyhypusine synthase [Methanomicrobiales archaeon]|nr:deoxyhypusine synthase [Methanomicrobiales archaeon]